MVEQSLQGLQGLQGFQALQGLPGLQGALLHDEQRRKAAELMAVRQAHAQQMSELVARHEHQIAAVGTQLKEVSSPEFAEYSKQVVANARALGALANELLMGVQPAPPPGSMLVLLASPPPS